MEYIIVCYVAITIVIYTIGIFIDIDEKSYIGIVLWPIWVIKMLLKELFKLLFTDWK